MTSRRPSALDDFVNQLDALVRKYTDRGRIDGAAIVREAHPYLADLIYDTGWLEERHRKVTGESAAYLLAAAPDDSWTVLSVVFPAGSSTPVHDHLTWGLVAVHQGIEEESRYECLDHGSRASFARLRYVDTTRNEPGSISYVVPPQQEIHSIHNALDIPSCSIHVYGGHLDRMPRHRYDPEKNAVYDYRPAYASAESLSLRAARAASISSQLDSKEP